MEPSTAITDEGLALRAAAGRRDAFEALVFRYGAALLAVVERQAGDHHEALDLVQEVWLKVFRALPRYQPGGSFRSWLFSIALNHGRDARRRRQRSRVVFIDEYRADAAPGGDPSGRAEEHAAIETALAAVPEPFRTALLLVDVTGLSYEEAAASLDCAVGTVKSRVSRGRFAFRDVYLQADAGRAAAPRRPCQPG